MMNAKIRLILVMIWIAVGVSAACAPTPASTAAPKISREKAIEIATAGCSLGHLQLIGKPENIRAKLMTLQQVEDQFDQPGDFTSFSQPMTISVWLVQMDGDLLLVGGPLPISTDGHLLTPTPAQPFRGTCDVTVDATTGDVIEVRG